MSWSLSGRAALVTGGSHGLGLEIARAYLEAGADIFICGRDEKALERAREELAAAANSNQRRPRGPAPPEGSSAPVELAPGPGVGRGFLAPEVEQRSLAVYEEVADVAAI